MAFNPAAFGKWAHKAIQVDAGTMERARKVAALYHRGATQGERDAALARLQVIAARAGVDAEMLLKCLS